MVSETQAKATAIDTVIEGFFPPKLPLLKGTSGFSAAEKKNTFLLLDVGILLARGPVFESFHLNGDPNCC